jgi:hypothetical protein
MNVQFRDSTPRRRCPFLFYVLRKKLTDVRGALPDGLIGPNVNDEYGDVDSILYALTGRRGRPTPAQGRREALRQRLCAVPGVVKVNLYGVRTRRSSSSSATPSSRPRHPAADAVRLARPPERRRSGRHRGNGGAARPVRVSGALDGERAVAETPVEAGGRTFRLGGHRHVSRGYEDPPAFWCASAAGRPWRSAW